MERKPIAQHRYTSSTGNLLAIKFRYPRESHVRCEWVRPLPPGTAGAGPNTGPNTKHGVHGLGAGTYWGELRGEHWHYYHTAGRIVPDGAPLVELPDVQPALFNLVEVSDPDKWEQPIYLVEGESDVETLRRIFCIATCGAHGSQWDPEWARHFLDRDVVIIPDNDLPGRTYAQFAVGSMFRWAKSVRLLTPGLSGYDPPEGGGDITDWFKARGLVGGLEQIQALQSVVNRAPLMRRE